MKINTKLFMRFITATVFIITAYHPFAKANTLTQSPLPTTMPIWQKIRLPNFTRIKIQGSVKLDIISSNDNQNRLVYTHNSTGHLIFQVKNHTLSIRGISSQFSSHKWIYLTVNRLTHLEITGSTQIYFQHIHSQHGITLTTNGNGVINLNGKIPLRKIIKRGAGHVFIAWVDACQLTIEANQGHLALAGIATQMYTRLSGSAHLKAKYLRAKQIWIQAQNQSYANVMPIQSMNAFASNHATIDYYKTPKQLFTDTQQHGQIMQIAQWR